MQKKEKSKRISFKLLSLFSRPSNRSKSSISPGSSDENTLLRSLPHGQGIFLKSMAIALGFMASLHAMKIPPSEVFSEEDNLYKKFLTGKLIYNGDDGEQVVLMNDIADPSGKFDLSKCGNAEDCLVISTGYHTEVKDLQNKKIEIWIAPWYWIEKNIDSVEHIGSYFLVADILWDDTWFGAASPPKKPVLSIIWRGVGPQSKLDEFDMIALDENLCNGNRKNSASDKDDLFALWKKSYKSNEFHYNMDYIENESEWKKEMKKFRFSF